MNIAKQLITYYLILFMIGCSTKPPITIEKAREMETQIIYGNSKEVLKASMNILQDMYYSIDEINSDMGLLIATKATEGNQAEIRKEQAIDEENSIWKKILIGVFVVTILGGIMLIVGSKQNNSNQDESSHTHHTNPIFSNRNNNNKELYKYKITINASDFGVDETKLRVSAVGQKLSGDKIINSGPIHDAQFYQNFFNKLNEELGY